MDPDKPTISQIKLLATKPSFERGNQYYYDDCVISAKITHGAINGKVSGTRDHTVKISNDLGKTSYSCTCPYSDGGICKHIVAMLLYTSKHFKQMKRDEAAKKKIINKLFVGISDTSLKEFLRYEMEQNDNLEVRFISYFEKDHDIPMIDYKSKIDSLYKDADREYDMIEYGYEIDFDEFFDIAKSKEKSKDYAKAARIYRDIAESISDNMDCVDDSNGHYGSCFSDAISSMISCITKQRPTHQEKRPYISFMFEKYIKGADYFTEHYMSTIHQICTDRHDYVYLESLLEPYLPNKIPHKRYQDRHRYANKKISLQIYILKKLRSKSIQDLYSRYYRDSEDICLTYIKYLKRHNLQKMHKIIREGVKCHPHSRTLKKIALSTYKKTDRQYRDLVLELYLDSLNSKYYVLLKSMPKWNKTFKKITNHYTKRRRSDGLIDIYLTEKMNSKALDLVISSKNLNTLSKYQKRLAALYPHEYFEAYRSLIFRFARSRTGRGHYNDVGSYLKKIKKIPKHRSEFQKLVNTLKKNNRTKPAFLDVLGRV